MTDVLADRRQALRYPLIAMAEVTQVATGVKITARTSDVSRTGCYVDTRTAPPSGAMIVLRLTNQGELFETHARVVYVRPGLGMGVRFHEFVSASQLATLEHWLNDLAKSL